MNKIKVGMSQSPNIKQVRSKVRNITVYHSIVLDIIIFVSLLSLHKGDAGWCVASAGACRGQIIVKAKQRMARKRGTTACAWWASHMPNNANTNS